MQIDRFLGGPMAALYGYLWRAWYRDGAVSIGHGGAGRSHVVIGTSRTETEALQNAVDHGYWDD